VWVFREALRKEDLVKRLFDEINARLVDSNVIATAGQIVDATFVEAPRQRNTREENKVIKDGGIPPGWEEPPIGCAKRTWTRAGPRKMTKFITDIRTILWSTGKARSSPTMW